MSFMFELYYRSPEDAERENHILCEVVAGGGHLDFRENMNCGHTICLTYEFDDFKQGELVMEKLRQSGEYIEGLNLYGE